MIVSGSLAVAGAFVALRKAAPESSPIHARSVSVSTTVLPVGAEGIPVVGPALRIVAQTIPSTREPPSEKFPEANEWVLPGDILFKFGRANFTERGRARMTKTVATLRHAGVRRVRIEGHTDASGPALYNLDLSRRRVCAVAVWVRRALGTDAPQMEVLAFGEAQPIAPNIHPDGSDDPIGRKRNRRVEIRLPGASPRGDRSRLRARPALPVLCRA